MVSVCMATCNGEQFVKEQIESILKQISYEDELIISDDGSSDNTILIIESMKDSRIRLLLNDQHDYTANFENALKHAKGDYIFLSDQDDIWSDDKVGISLKYLQKYDFLHSNAVVVDSNLNVIEKSRNDRFNIRNGFMRNMIKTYYIGCCMAFRKEVLQVALPFPKKHDLCKHDGWIALIAELFFETCVCKDKLILYRRTGTNVSSGSCGFTNTVRNMIKIRIYILKELLIRKRRILRNEIKNSYNS